MNRIIRQVLLVLLISIFLIQIFSACGSDNKSVEYEDTVRCSWCGKVIRSDGKNIHGKPVYNGNTLECEYCGHKTNIIKK